MHTIEIQITPEGKKRLQYYADAALSAGHWGSSDIVIPDEQALAHKIHMAGGTLELSVRECRLLLDWFAESTGDGRFLLPEDADLIIGIREAIEMYLKGLERHYQYEKGNADMLARIISRILPIDDTAAAKIADAVVGPAAAPGRTIVTETLDEEELSRFARQTPPARGVLPPERAAAGGKDTVGSSGRINDGHETTEERYADRSGQPASGGLVARLKKWLAGISDRFTRERQPGSAFEYDNIDDMLARSRRLAKKVSGK